MVVQAPRRSSALARFCTPTLADAMFVLLLLRVLQLGTTNLFNDPGTGWHLRTGHEILATGAVPVADTYSYTRAGQPWVATQWLADAIMSVAYAVGGYPLLALITAGKLRPEKLVGRRISLQDAPAELAQMDSFPGTGIAVIDRF